MKEVATPLLPPKDLVLPQIASVPQGTAQEANPATTLPAGFGLAADPVTDLLDDLTRTDNSVEVLDDGTIESGKSRYVPAKAEGQPLPENVLADVALHEMMAMLVTILNRQANTESRRQEDVERRSQISTVKSLTGVQLQTFAGGNPKYWKEYCTFRARGEHS